MDFLMGGLAASAAGFFSNPFDVLKTRMQLQGELRSKGQHAVHYRNVFQAGYIVFQNEGVKGLQKGVGTAMVLHGIRNSVRLGTYQWLTKNGYLTDTDGRTILHRSAIASALSGAAGALAGSPLFLVKTQLQSQAAKEIAVGHQHGHSGAFQAIKNIYTEHGLKGLWRGASGTVARALAGSSAQLTSFAIAKERLRDVAIFENNPLLISVVGSIISGVFQTVIISPFDVVSVRLYNQPVDANGKGILYKGLIDCLIKIGKSEGVFGYYKGMVANYMRLAPHGMLCLVFWDTLKDFQAQYLENNVFSRKNNL